jgi:hypothetical protein
VRLYDEASGMADDRGWRRLASRLGGANGQPTDAQVAALAAIWVGDARRPSPVDRPERTKHADFTP